MRTAPLVIAIAVACAGCGGAPDTIASSTDSAACAATEAGDIVVSDAWIRTASADQGTSALYLTVCNGGDQPNSLIGASAAIANAVELHETTRDAEGVVSMAPIKTLSLAPGKAVALAPGGAHLMLIGLTKAISEGDSASITLEFENGASITVEAKAIAAASMAHDH